jgi:F-type H+-transporting ATPase subunit a
MLAISLRAETLFNIGSFPVTNGLLMSTLVLVLLAVLAFVLRSKLKMVPGAMQNAFEMLLEGALSVMDTLFGNRPTSEKYFPLVFTTFIFILFSNWLGLLPGVGSVIVNQSGGAVPLLRSPSSDLNFTLALALIGMTFVNAASAVAEGFWHRLSVFFNFKGPVDFFIGILELISEIGKIISLSFRLFGNVFAGEVLLAIMAFLVPYALPLPFMMLEVFVGFIQAFIFAMLIAVFVQMSLAHGAEDVAHEAVEAAKG